MEQALRLVRGDSTGTPATAEEMLRQQAILGQQQSMFKGFHRGQDILPQSMLGLKVTIGVDASGDAVEVPVSEKDAAVQFCKEYNFTFDDRLINFYADYIRSQGILKVVMDYWNEHELPQRQATQFGVGVRRPPAYAPHFTQAGQQLHAEGDADNVADDDPSSAFVEMNRPPDSASSEQLQRRERAEERLFQLQQTMMTFKQLSMMGDLQREQQQANDLAEHKEEMALKDDQEKACAHQREQTRIESSDAGQKWVEQRSLTRQAQKDTEIELSEKRRQAHLDLMKHATDLHHAENTGIATLHKAQMDGLAHQNNLLLQQRLMHQQNKLMSAEAMGTSDVGTDNLTSAFVEMNRPVVLATSNNESPSESSFMDFGGFDVRQYFSNLCGETAGAPATQEEFAQRQEMLRQQMEIEAQIEREQVQKQRAMDLATAHSYSPGHGQIVQQQFQPPAPAIAQVPKVPIGVDANGYDVEVPVAEKEAANTFCHAMGFTFTASLITKYADYIRLHDIDKAVQHYWDEHAPENLSRQQLQAAAVPAREKPQLFTLEERLLNPDSATPVAVPAQTTPPAPVYQPQQQCAAAGQQLYPAFATPVAEPGQPMPEAHVHQQQHRAAAGNQFADVHAAKQLHHQGANTSPERHGFPPQQPEHIQYPQPQQQQPRTITQIRQPLGYNSRELTQQYQKGTEYGAADSSSAGDRPPASNPTTRQPHHQCEQSQHLGYQVPFLIFFQNFI